MDKTRGVWPPPKKGSEAPQLRIIAGRGGFAPPKIPVSQCSAIKKNYPEIIVRFILENHIKNRLHHKRDFALKIFHGMG